MLLNANALQTDCAGLFFSAIYTISNNRLWSLLWILLPHLKNLQWHCITQNGPPLGNGGLVGLSSNSASLILEPQTQPLKQMRGVFFKWLGIFENHNLDNVVLSSAFSIWATNLAWDSLEPRIKELNVIIRLQDWRETADNLLPFGDKLEAEGLWRPCLREPWGWLEQLARLQKAQTCA